MAESSRGDHPEGNESEMDSIPKDLPDSEEEAVKATLQKISVVTSELAQLMFNSGLRSLNDVSSAGTNELEDIDGLNQDKAQQIKEEAKKLLKKDESGDNQELSNWLKGESDEELGGLMGEETEEAEEKDIDVDEKHAEEVDEVMSETDKETEQKGEEEELSEWLQGESDEELGGMLGDEIEKAREAGPEASKDIDKEQMDEEEDTEALEAWLSGEEDSFSEWLGEESFEEEKEELEEEKEELEEKEKDLKSQMEEISTLRQEFKSKIEGIESGDFEPQEIVEENAELKEDIDELESRMEELQEEKQELEDEIDEIKQGSVAMLKYLKTKKKEGEEVPDAVMQEGTGGGEIDEELKEELEELREENQELKDRIDEIKSGEDISEMADSDIKEELKEKDKELKGKEREVKKKEDKIQELENELGMKKDELENLHEKLEYKDEELNKREEDLRHREKKIQKQKKELEQQKQELGDMSEKERQRRLEELEKKIEKKEQELKAKEDYINQKEKELRAKEEDLIDEELEERENEILQEVEQEKAKTGTGRLDDLMLGGIPLGSNVSIYGPPHVGKEIMVNSFMAEGVEKGVPIIWVVTDKTIEDIREDMKFILPTYEEYEKRGLVYYVDAYSVSMGEVVEEEKKKDYVTYIEEQSDVKAITQAVDEFANELAKDNRYYRMAFMSVSTIIAYLDTETTFRQLQPFAGRRKRQKAVSLYTLEKGMHSEQDISMLGHMMTGEIEFKVDQMQNYLRVQGLGDVQTRDWVEYTSSKTGITMGSFSLDTIR